MNVHAAVQVGIASLLSVALTRAASADAISVQCAVDKYRSSFSPRPEVIVVQVDLDARTITSYYGTTPLKMTNKELRGVARVDGGWQTSIVIDRNSGRVVAGVDKVERWKYSYAELKGMCILPIDLRGAKYRSPLGE